MEVFSNGEDAMWLAYQLKNQMDGYVSFNKFGITNPILTGVYCAKGHGGNWYGKEDVRFYIKFCKGEFLRIQIPTGLNKNEHIINALDALIDAIGKINVEDKPLGFPLAIYRTDESLTTEYDFKNPEDTIRKLEEDTMFDDGGHVSNLKLLGTKEKNKDTKIYCKEICSAISK